MTALIIIAAIVLIVVILLNIPVCARVKYIGGKLELTVKYLRFKLFSLGDDDGKGEDDDDSDISDSDSEDNPSDEECDVIEPFGKPAVADEPAKDNSPPKNPKKETDDDPPKKKKEKRSLSQMKAFITEKKEQIMLGYQLLEEDLVKLFKKITVKIVRLDFAAADVDAANAAMLYGKMCAAVYPTLGTLSTVFRFSCNYDRVKLYCLYNTDSKCTRYDGEVLIKLRPASLVNAVAAILLEFLTNKDKYSPLLRLFSQKG